MIKNKANIEKTDVFLDVIEKDSLPILVLLITDIHIL